MKGQYFKKHKFASSVSDDVMKNGILIGCHHGLKLKELKYMCKTFDRLKNISSLRYLRSKF